MRSLLKEPQRLWKCLRNTSPYRITLLHCSKLLKSEGQINTSPRNHIETVVYFSHKPNLDNLLKVIIKLVKNNVKLLAILDCDSHETVRSQMQLTNSEGVTKTSVIKVIYHHVSVKFLMLSSCLFFTLLSGLSQTKFLPVVIFASPAFLILNKL